MTTDPIAAARALIEPLTGYTPKPWWTSGKYSGREMGCSIIAANPSAGPAPGNPTRGQVAFATAILNTDARRCEGNARLIAAAPDLRDMVPTLADALEAERAKRQRAEAERDQALARLAVHAATKPMVDAAFNALPPDACGMIGSGEMYRVLDAALKAEPPADAQDALDKMLAEARLEGWRAGREAAARSCVLSGQDLAEGDWGPEGRDMAVMLEARVLALPEPKEASHV